MPQGLIESQKANTLHTQRCSARCTALVTKNSMKSISAIHQAITKTMKNSLMKCCTISQYKKVIMSQFQPCQTHYVVL